MKSTSQILLLILLSVSCCMTSCSDHKLQRVLDRAESLMETHPDSALILLEEMDKGVLGSKKERARYALLMSMALDRNYIETTKFDVLQPAVDYYLKHGNPNETLKTYYYQGRIYQNGGDRDNALNSFVKGIDNSSNCTDSITLVRMLLAQAFILYEFHDFDSYIAANLRAADISGKLSKKDYEFISLINALNGALVTDNKSMCDSIIRLCGAFKDMNEEQKSSLLELRISYTETFGTKQDLESILSHNNNSLESEPPGALRLASAYNRLGDNQKATRLLDYVRNQKNSYDTLKYQAILVAVYKDIGDYKNALSTYERFSQKLDSINYNMFEQKAKSLEEKHALELKAQQDAREKAGIIWGCMGGILFLAMVVVILLLLFRSNKSQKELAVEKARASELENRSLKSEKENLALENTNLQLERDKKALEAENLANRVANLENERTQLKELIDSQKELPSEVQEAIKVRIEMLNAMMAGYITDNEKYGQTYESLIKDLTDNTEEFMNSNRLAFQASHPRFIQYFEDHGLTVGEINYVCLYAIGLKGKEVGSYMKKRSHVNISSAIRKKLGIDRHETNIGIYVRKLLKGL